MLFLRARDARREARICGLNLYAFRKDIRALKNSMYPIEFYLLAETMNKG